jgi:lipopolysaccharide transport system ATP-binding protein
MSKTVIRVENLSKKYRIQHQRETQRYSTLRDAVTNRAKGLLRGNLQSVGTNSQSEDFWALRDISFEVKEGEVVGIIGRNGAGKSTLLKILSRITEPTNGRIGIKGRVASLLEVGTGFHPELTGRENIYLNGAILGMSREEIKRKFDEIVAFAEIEKFLDTPVKRYSSGMYVRLAFAVAAYLEPEILVVDEVLAVGDAQFQQKSLGKMENVAQSGRTVLFVSHNMSAIRKLCTSAILLNKGCCISHGFVENVVREYYNGFTKLDASTYTKVSGAMTDRPHFTSIIVKQQDGPNSGFRMDLPIEIELVYNHLDITETVVTVLIRNTAGIVIHHATDEFSTEPSTNRQGKRVCVIPAYALNEDDYFITVALGVRYGELFEKLEDVIKLSVLFTGLMSDRTQAVTWKGVCGPGFLQWV